MKRMLIPALLAGGLCLGAAAANRTVYLADTHGPGNITSDPLFANASAGDYTLGPRSRCRNAAKLFDWMTDAADPRSRDLSGAPRLGGTIPDIGCYEYPFGQRTLLIVQ